MLDGRVDFLIAGVQKGGTTALHAYLAEHPGLNLAAEKEVHFFDDETVDWAAPDYGAYHARFAPAAGRTTGETTPIYVYWPESLERARRYNPSLRLVLLFRDPSRAPVALEDGARRGWRTEPFAWCIREGRRGWRRARIPGPSRVFSTSSAASYVRAARRGCCVGSSRSRSCCSTLADPQERAGRDPGAECATPGGRSRRRWTRRPHACSCRRGGVGDQALTAADRRALCGPSTRRTAPSESLAGLDLARRGS